MIPLFHPFMTKEIIGRVTDTLNTRWLGQGPRVDEFEKAFQEHFCPNNYCVATGAGTHALHLAYIMAGIQPGNEVIVPVFTCTATNTPLLWMGAKIVFADIQPDTMNIDPDSISELITERTKAIVCVHYGGTPCDLDRIHFLANEFNIPVIEDAAQALGGKYKEEYIGNHSTYTMFSFQAIKHMTTGDGGMLVLENKNKIESVRRRRWFGIDRAAKLDGIWENNIWEVGYKYQMTDIAATMGLGALDVIDTIIDYRKMLFDLYCDLLHGCSDVIVVGKNNDSRESAAWLITILVDRREALQRKLKENNIESGVVHYRNDRYTVFEQFKRPCPNMDAREDKYLVLPLHPEMRFNDVEKICEVIKEGW